MKNVGQCVSCFHVNRGDRHRTTNVLVYSCLKLFMWWHWVTWCGCPAVPGDAVGVFPSLHPPTMVAW